MMTTNRARIEQPTAEPPNADIVARIIVHCREVVLISGVAITLKVGVRGVVRK